MEIFAEAVPFVEVVPFMECSAVSMDQWFPFPLYLKICLREGTEGARAGKGETCDFTCPRSGSKETNDLNKISSITCITEKSRF